MGIMYLILNLGSSETLLLIELSRPGVFGSWYGHPCRIGWRIETRLSVVPWSSRLGVGLRADNTLSETLLLQKQERKPRGGERAEKE